MAPRFPSRPSLSALTDRPLKASAAVKRSVRTEFNLLDEELWRRRQLAKLEEDFLSAGACARRAIVFWSIKSLISGKRHSSAAIHLLASLCCAYSRLRAKGAVMSMHGAGGGVGCMAA